MTKIRLRFVEDMKLSGLSDATQEIYVKAVRKLAEHYRRSPDQLSEEEVRRYFLVLKERGVARGTFKVCHYGIQFFYRNTLGKDWSLFKKRFGFPDRSGCRRFCQTPRFGKFWTLFAARSTGLASA